ncbi:glycosyltransferase family 4 protein [Bosea sp. ASV33]|uniref:glycosyltransferase family 4 protein n=1 Tax=Bosea sp. ASV33 TaxID=2795106 RepID=UPI0018EC24D3|nr:glycosyltransferase family 4 protein [Bosea sp. ASV33]
MTRKRILVVTYEFPPLLGGVGTYCVEIARAATALGHDVTVVAPTHDSDNASYDAGLPFAVERLPIAHYTRNSLRCLMVYARRLMRRDIAQFDIVHLADWPPIVAARMVALLRPLRFRVILHGTDALLLNQARLPRLLGAGRALALAEKVVANSRYTLAIARREHPAITDASAEVALLGVGPSWFGPVAGEADLRSRYGIPQDRRILLSVSRLDERKGHRHVLEALARLSPAEKAQVVYVVVGKAGDPAHAETLRRQAAGIGLPVIFTGPLPEDDVRALYAAAYLFLLLGEDRNDKIEGFGLVYLEAGAQGVPSIASPVGGVPEVVLDGRTGRLVDYRDPVTVAGVVGALLADETERDRLGAQARDWAGSLTWARCAELTFG